MFVMQQLLEDRTRKEVKKMEEHYWNAC